jgi:hypothetical protein
MRFKPLSATAAPHALRHISVGQRQPIDPPAVGLGLHGGHEESGRQKFFVNSRG